MSSDSHPSDCWTAFGLGVFGGVIAGVTLLSFAGLQVFGILAFACTALIRPRAFALSGLWLSIAVTWTALIIQGATGCREPPCAMDPTPWIAASVLVGVAGLVLLVSGARRRRSDAKGL